MNCILRTNVDWREELRYGLRVLPVAVFLMVILLPFFMAAHRKDQEERNARLNVRVYLNSAADTAALHRIGVGSFVARSDDYVDAIISGKQLLELRQRGFDVALIVEVDTSATAPVGWPTVEEVEHRIFSLERLYPEVCHVFSIGKSAFYGRKIWALRISDRPGYEEDEPSVLFTGGMHAREPLGMMACLELAEKLARDYNHNPTVTQWIRSMQIYVVPLVNPDGYGYIVEKHVRYPWWRKNLADNDGNGVFDPRVDGVDLNRNFGFNWFLGGDGRPSSWFYRGSRPFSEPETQALRDLAMRVRPVAGISFHSHGEVVFYPWTNYPPPVDAGLLKEMANQMASVARSCKGGHYEVYPLNGRVGQSSCWLYNALSCFDFTVEVGDQYFPPLERVPQFTAEAVKIAFYLLSRVQGAGLWLRVLDAVTNRPLVATVRIEELGEGPGAVRHTDPFWGRYRCLLRPGVYTLCVQASNHMAWRHRFKVSAGKPTELTVVLTRKMVTASTEKE